MWTQFQDSETAEDWVIDGAVLATVRRPAVTKDGEFPWFASVLYEGDAVVAGLFPNRRAAKASALALIAEFS